MIEVQEKSEKWCVSMCTGVCLGIERRQETHIYTQPGGEEERRSDGRRGRQRDTHADRVTHGGEEKRAGNEGKDRQICRDKERRKLAKSQTFRS